MRIVISTLAVAISLTVFGCSESPSSSSTEDSSSSVLSSSSSSIIAVEGTACEYSGEEFGIAGPFVCKEAPSFLGSKAECEKDGGSWVSTCPSEEKATCISEENTEDVLYKLYADGFSCGDLMLKNADGSEDIVPKGGACGPFTPKNVPISMCVDFPELSTNVVRLSCVELDAPFAKECPINTDLTCYQPEEGIIYHFYGEAVFPYTCKNFGLVEN